MRVSILAAAAVVSLAAAGVAYAALPKDKALAIMHARHEGMEKIGDTNKLLRRELTSSAPFAPAVKSGAATIFNLSPINVTIIFLSSVRSTFVAEGSAKKN